MIFNIPLNQTDHPMRILVVCLGNICRSPIAEGLFRKRILEQNLPWEVDSAGTGSWHIGEMPDHRSVSVCRSKGLDISGQRARQIRMEDFYHFDRILAMDQANEDHLLKMRPDDARARVSKMLDFIDPDGQLEVPDPYWDGRFHEVYELLDDAVEKAVDSFMANQSQDV